VSAILGPLGACLLYVDDLDGTARFYRDVLGLRISHQSDGAIAFDAGSCILELMSAAADATERGRGPSRLVLSFRVDDLDAARARLAAAGVEQIGPVRPTIGLDPPFHIARFSDPEDNLFELIDMPAA
jgi:catechol 2,3-dioxygenase-like lactoylglutathione lyase family enzyme